LFVKIKDITGKILMKYCSCGGGDDDDKYNTFVTQFILTD